MMRATLTLDKKHLDKKMLGALEPEVEEGMNRVKASIEHDPPRILIEAEDSRALRAALNSYLRWLGITDEISDKYAR
ncbi:MAG: KEOPS complex subunit Pcc1 [Thermoplasmata archaeon]